MNSTWFRAGGVLRWCVLLIMLAGSHLAAGDCAPALRLVPKPGTYPCIVPVIPVVHLSAGERLVYTVDGTVPTAAAWPLNRPVILTDSTTMRVGVINPQGGLARETTGAYVINSVLATARPVAVPAGGTYPGPISVTLSSPTTGSTIRYTVNGQEPTDNSPRYTAALNMTADTTLRARAFGGRLRVRVGPFWVTLPAVFPSGVMTARYVIGGQVQQVAAPVITPAAGTYRSVLSASATTTTSGAELRYRLDGADPQATDPLLPTGGVAITRSLSLAVRGFRTGWTPSAVVRAEYALQVPDPGVSPAGGLAHAPLTATVTVSTDAVARYTVDGSDPSIASPIVTAPLTIDRSVQLRVRAFRDGWTPSDAIAVAWTLQPLAPTASLPAGSYVGGQSVTVSTATAGAQVRYTLDGSTPTAASPLATDPVVLPGSCTLQAIAVRDGWTDSTITSAVYTLQVPTPTLDVAAGSYAIEQQVQIQAVAGATITYTRDGTDPATSTTAQIASGPIVIDRSQTLTVRASLAGWTASASVQAAYVLALPAVTLSPTSGTYGEPVQVSAALPAGATAVYTVDGSPPMATSTAWPVAGLIIGQGATLTVVAVRDGWTASAPVVATYAFQAAAPTADLAAGPWSTEQDVTLTATAPGVVIRYSMDGSDPTADTALTAGGAIHLDHSLTLRAVTTAPGWLTSSELAVDYVFRVAEPVFSPAPGAATGSVQVDASTATAGAAVRATTDGSDPTEASPLLPITLTRSATLTARAFRSGWQPSPAVSGAWVVTPIIAFTASTLSLPVDAGAVAIGVRLSDATDHDVTVTLQGIDGTAVFGTDLTLSATALTIPAGQTEGSVTVQALAGAADRVTVQAQVVLQNAVGAALGSATNRVITIPGVSGPPPIFTERRSPLWRLPKESFDAGRWATDTEYRSAYVAAVVPERIWETGDTEMLKASIKGSLAQAAITPGSVIDVEVVGVPDSPINILCATPEVVSCEGVLYRCVQLDYAGVYAVRFVAKGLGNGIIMLSSPRSKNLIRMRISVVEFDHE